MQFNADTFVGIMKSKWKTSDTLKSSINLYAKYCDYTGVNAKKSNYRTWLPDSQQVATGSKQQAAGGIVVSCKLDHVRGGTQSDDHLVLVLFFDQNKLLVGGQAILGINDEDPNPTALVSSDSLLPGDTVSGRLFIELWGKLQKSYSSSNDGRQDFPDVAKANIDAISGSIES